MESRELALLKKIKLITGKKLNTLFVGEYHSAFKGFGLSFESVREYQYGDDIRSIDWNVSARMNHLYVKEYSEERELSVVFLVDVSGSTSFGSKKTKWDAILETVTLLLYLAQMNNDRVSVILFSDRIEKVIKPGRGRKYVLKVLDDIIKTEPSGRKTDIGAAVDFMNRVIKKRSVVFVVSDFLETKENYYLRIRRLAKKHDVIPVQVFDPLEKKSAFFGLTEFVDLESGEVFMSDSLPGRGKLPELMELGPVVIDCSKPVTMPILEFFERRNRTHLVSL